MRKRISQVGAMLILALVLGVLTTTIVNAQAGVFGRRVWAGRHNTTDNADNWAGEIAVDRKNNVYVAGSSSGDITVIKYNRLGREMWKRRYNGPLNGDDSVVDLIIDGENIYLAGTTYKPGSAGGDFLAVKFDTGGTLKWARTYNGPGNGNDTAVALAVDGAGSVCIAGTSYGGSPSSADFAVVKYDYAGNRLWTQRYNGVQSGFDRVGDIEIDSEHSIYVTGSAASANAQSDMVILKYDPTGNLIWAQSYDGLDNGSDVASAVAVYGETIYVAGHSYSFNSGFDYTLIRYNAGGRQEWVRKYDGPAGDVDAVAKMVLDYRGNIYITGGSRGSNNKADYATLKYNSQGGLVWARRYDGPGNDIDSANDLFVDGRGNVFITGQSTGRGGDTDYATIKYSAPGTKKWVRRYDARVDRDDAGAAIAVDSGGKAYITGYSYGGPSGYDFFTIKYGK